MFTGQGNVGVLGVLTTTNRGFSPDELTEQALDKVLFVADTAPPAIREQAHAFRDRLAAVLRFYLAQMQKSSRTSMVAQLRAAGYHDAASHLEKY